MYQFASIAAYGTIFYTNPMSNLSRLNDWRLNT